MRKEGGKLLAQTHSVISAHMSENIENRLGISLNKKLLSLGNMMPDIWPSLAVKKHYKEQSFDFVIDQIEKLIAGGLYENQLSIDAFSLRLGIVSHFLSDFFCLPHHNREYFHDKLREHLSYENKLHEQFKNFSGIKSVNTPYIQNTERQNIVKFIEELHLEYKNSKSGYITDIYGSINVSSAVGILVVENSLVTSDALQKAASF